MEFDIPHHLTDLEAPQREGAIGPKHKLDVAGMSDAESNELVERVAYDLCENDALCILEQEVWNGTSHSRYIAVKTPVSSSSFFSSSSS
jgi:hypothetical protein